MNTELAMQPAQATTLDDEWAFLDRDEEVPSTPRTQVQANPGTGELHGFYYDMPFDVYAAVPALNASQVLAMRRSPMQYRWSRDHKREETEALLEGKFIHMLTLEPHLSKGFAVWGNQAEHLTDAGKVRPRNGKLWDEFRNEHDGEVILTVNQHTRIMDTVSAALENAPIRHYAYAPGHTEVSAFWRCPYTDQRMKGRFDKMLSDEHCLPDLKTTRSSQPFLFARSAWSLGYVHKMAHYWNGYRTLTGHEPRMPLLAIEKTGPCEGAVYNIPREHLMQALDEFTGLVRRIADCEKANAWPPIVETEQDLELPPYAFSEEDDASLELEL